MDPTIIAGVIGAGGSVIGAFIAVIFHQRRKTAESQRVELEAALGKSRQVLSEVAPYTIKKLIKEVSFDENGKGEQKQEWHGIKANQRYENLEIPFRFYVDGRLSELAEPKGKELDGSSLSVQLICEPSKNSKSNKKELRGRFRILGYCDKDSDPISFFWLQGFSGAFLLTREEVQNAFEGSGWLTEYSASSVVVPTESLEMHISFPITHKEKVIKPSPVAFVGGTHVVNRQETARIIEGFRFVDDRASLLVKEPIVGMTYAISWMPPPK